MDLGIDKQLVDNRLTMLYFLRCQWLCLELKYKCKRYEQRIRELEKEVVELKSRCLNSYEKCDDYTRYYETINNK